MTRCLPLPTIAYRRGRLEIDTTDMNDAAIKAAATADAAVIATASSTGGPGWATVEQLLDVDARAGGALEKAYEGHIRRVLEGCAAEGLTVGCCCS